MTRRAQPYTSVPHNTTVVVGGTPTPATRRRYGNEAGIGLLTKGHASARVPVLHPYPGQGANFPAFPHFTGSSVAPDLVGVNILVARNLYSPSGHSNPLSDFVPPQAVPPSVMRRPPQTQSGRGSGVFSIPSPPVNQWWPTSQQWLAQRMASGQLAVSQPPSGWASSRVQSK